MVLQQLVNMTFIDVKAGRLYYTSTSTLTDGQVIDFTLNTTWTSGNSSIVSLSMSDGNTKIYTETNSVGSVTITGSWKMEKVILQLLKLLQQH